LGSIPSDEFIIFKHFEAVLKKQGNMSGQEELFIMIAADGMQPDSDNSFTTSMSPKIIIKRLR
jgi:hypothetical protein